MTATDTIQNTTNAKDVTELSNSNVGFGLARIKTEGSPVHPLDMDWECDVSTCKLCKKKWDIQLRAYNKYWRIKDANHN